MRRTGWRWVERILFVVGIACLGYFGLMWADRWFEQARENRELDRILESRTAAPTGPARRASRSAALGRLEIPRLGVSAAVREGDDARTLQRAVGHIPGTALPGADGNAGLAAHRDTFFRRLKDIRARDEITFTAPDAVHRYVVEDTRVVEPNDVAVLDPTPAATMTLVTCYPFNYVGTAPRRFIVRAVRRDAAGTGIAAVPAGRARSVQVNETDRVVRPIVKQKARARAARTVKTAATARPVGKAAGKGNALARFFKAAARGLGFAPRETRVSAQNE